MSDLLDRLEAVRDPLTSEAAAEIRRLQAELDARSRPTSARVLDLPAKARVTDPGTSHTAAKLFGRLNQRTRILLAFYEAWPEGLTAEEACARAGLGRWGHQRVSELRYTLADLGGEPMVRDTGDRRPSSTGAPQQVDRITDAGRRWVEAHHLTGGPRP